MDKIELKVKKHDEFQLEMKITCPIRKNESMSSYYADVFFFLPRNLAVNPQTYSANKFYNDLSEYIRFQTPTAELNDLADRDNVIFSKLASSIATDDDSSYQQKLKMFCSIVRKTFRNEMAKIIKCADCEIFNQKILNYLSNSAQIMDNFRKLQQTLSNGGEKLEVCNLADEFLSVNLNNCLYKIWKMPLLENSCCNQAKQAIIERTYQEIEYRKSCNYISIVDEKSDNSEFLYRESTLKKAMSSVLFLNIALKKDGILLENLFLGLAAAIAMIFVTAIAFIWKGLFLEEFSVSFFVVWVVAYMFKDRIKSQLQLLCLNKRNRYAYDYQQKIYDDFGNALGLCREGFQHCDVKDVPKEIERVRNRTALSKFESGSLSENILVYRKKIELNGRSRKGIFEEFEINGLTDIFRLNVRHWLGKMDNPLKTVYSSDGEKIEPIKAYRNYHVNIVLRYGEKGGEVHYSRYRLILNRNGIKKIIHF